MTGLFHGPVTVREALARSYNIPAIHVATRLGQDALLAHLRRLGFDHLHEEVAHYGATLVLGSGEVSPWELGRAYAALAREGTSVALRTTRAASLGDAHERAAPLLDPVDTQLVTRILADADARGDEASFVLPRQPFDAALKTGTSTGPRDSWAAGCTPEVTVVVWVGNFSGAAMRNTSGDALALPLWRDLVAAAMDGRSTRRFPAGDLTEWQLCTASGLRAHSGCPLPARFALRAGTEPRATCAAHARSAKPRRRP